MIEMLVQSTGDEMTGDRSTATQIQSGEPLVFDGFLHNIGR
jgi:hypothetical protein